MRNMKIAFVFLTWVIFAAAAFAEEETAGRFQLLSGIIEITGKGVSVQEHAVFRIDTKTGKTWTYTSGQGKDGKFKIFWSEIPEP